MTHLRLVLASVLAFAFVVSGLPVATKSPVKVSEFELKHVAVATVAPSYSGNGECSLLLTTFYPFGSDSVNVVTNPMSNPQITAVDTDAKWPNQADPLPEKISAQLGIERGILSASGFFVSPSKSTGAVTLYDTSSFPNATKVQLSTDDKDYFYHHAEWFDVDGDGQLDVIAARAKKPMFFGKPAGELVWIKKEGDSWREVVLAQGPDVAFTLRDVDGDGTVEVIAAQFFTAQQLSIWYCDAAHWSDCANNQTLVRSAVIDNDGVPFFNVQFNMDLNGDGKIDLLATTNTANGNGSVLAYEVPEDWKKGQWPKHRLATGYKPTKAILPGRGSPGTATAFHINASSGGKPSIVVSADDGGYVDLLHPVVEADPNDWTYSRNRMVNSTDTIGTVAVGDCNGDGVTDLFVPLFAENKVQGFTFK